MIFRTTPSENFMFDHCLFLGLPLSESYLLQLKKITLYLDGNLYPGQIFRLPSTG